MWKAILFSLNAILVFCFLWGCKQADPYEWEGHSIKDLQDLFQINISSFQKVADALLDNPEFWEKGKSYSESTHAWLGTPHDRTKMDCFSSDDQQFLMDFFEQTKPYRLSLEMNQYIIITYINEDNTGGYVIAYYPSNSSENEYSDFDKWQTYFDNFIVLSDSWYLYY